MTNDGVPIAPLASEYPTIARSVRLYDPVKTASIVGGLLTIPELQSNCCRLESLAHLAVAFGNGHRTPSWNTIATWFNHMNRGVCGQVEDPAEDAFTSLVTSTRGDFRILEGIWESAAFFLQRVVNVVEGMPSGKDWDTLRESIFSLLALSDKVCERAGLRRHQFGNRWPETELPASTKTRLSDYRHHVTFSRVWTCTR